jgi:hypothetical protein
LICSAALTWVVVATAGAGTGCRPTVRGYGLAEGMVKARAWVMVFCGAVRGARLPGLLALRSASGLGLPRAVRGQACPDSVQPSW